MTELIIETDGATGEFCSGIGYVLTTPDESISGARTIDEDITSMEAEFLAIAEALRVAHNRFDSIESCTVRTDAKPLVRKLRGSQDCSQRWQQYRRSYEWLCSKFDNVSIEYRRRELNRDAHDLAREALFRGRNC